MLTELAAVTDEEMNSYTLQLEMSQWLGVVSVSDCDVG